MLFRSHSCHASVEGVVRERDRLGETLFRRARHVVSENARVMTLVSVLERRAPAASHLEESALADVGRVLDASHASLRDDYAVSVLELDTMTDIARAHPGCYGARLMGAGFGGSAIALIGACAVESFAAHVTAAYAAATGLRPDVYVCRPSAGSSVEWLDA